MDESQSATRGQQYESIHREHGGYWRHDFIDHAYLYNLYFPPKLFFEHLSERIRELVLNYPVAQDVLAGLVGDLIGQPSERIVVGNGAAELIKILCAQLSRKLIVPVPSFNEYTNAAPANQVVEFALDPRSLRLDVDQFSAEAIRCQAAVTVVVTPNNPTSLRVPKPDLLRLLDALADHDCMLVVDESFMDFAANGEQESLTHEISEFPNLAIVKSMSKAYGICGLRLGYLLTANRTFRDKMRQGLHIWNVNGFAEEFLRLAPEYREEFTASCDRVRADRDRLFGSLCSIDDLDVFSPQANFVFCRLPAWAASGPEIARRLFVEHNIYIKDCAGKTMPESDRYVRLASRTPPENEHLVKALREVMSRK